MYLGPDRVWQLINDPHVNLLKATDSMLAEVPPAVVAIATQDVLRDEGLAFADMLQAAGKLQALLKFDACHCGIFMQVRSTLFNICFTLLQLLNHVDPRSCSPPLMRAWQQSQL